MMPRMKKASISLPNICRHSDRTEPLTPVLGSASSRLLAMLSLCLAFSSSVNGALGIVDKAASKSGLNQ